MIGASFSEPAVRPDPRSEPSVLFPTFTQTDRGASQHGDENGPWTTLGGRLYSQSGTHGRGRRCHFSAPRYTLCGQSLMNRHAQIPRMSGLRPYYVVFF